MPKTQDELEEKQRGEIDAPADPESHPSLNITSNRRPEWRSIRRTCAAAVDSAGTEARGDGAGDSAGAAADCGAASADQPNRFRHRIAQSVSESLGRPVHMREVKFTMLPAPGFTLTDFEVVRIRRSGRSR